MSLFQMTRKMKIFESILKKPQKDSSQGIHHKVNNKDSKDKKMNVKTICAFFYSKCFPMK